MNASSSSLIRGGCLIGLCILFCAGAASAATGTTRPSALAGGWYPADPAVLGETLDQLLDSASARPVTGTIRALIVPHAGYRFSGPTAAAAFSLVRGGDYDRVIVLAPSHRAAFHGLSIADVDAYETPIGPVPLDTAAIRKLRQSPLVTSVAEAHVAEHAIEIELPLLQWALKSGWRLVPILVGNLAPEDYAAAADLLRPLADQHTLIIASSDFTHQGPRFGYQPFPADDELPQHVRTLDDGAIERILAMDGAGLLAYRERTGITMCGIRPVAVLLDLLTPGAEVQRVAYATSGEITGDWGNSVSYAALAVTAPAPLSEKGAPSEAHADSQGLSEQAMRRLHGLAKLGVDRATLGRSEVPDAEILSAVDGLPPELQRHAGAFVTLWKNGELRGCIGHVPNDVPVYEAVLQSGVNAARNDRRFRPVQPDELADLELEVSVLTPPRPIDSIDAFEPGKHGITIRKDGHYAIYLPEVAPQMGWDRETTLSHLARKAGLPADAWREGAQLEIFTSIHYQAPYETGQADQASVAGATGGLGGTPRARNGSQPGETAQTTDSSD